MTRWRPPAAIVLSVGALMSAAGCLFVAPQDGSVPMLNAPPRPQNPTAFDRPAEESSVWLIESDELGELVQGFADRYYALISSACDKLSKDASSPEERLQIDRFQSRTITAVYDIASNPDPFSQLLDLTVVVTLTQIIADAEAKAAELLGSSERALILTTPLSQAHGEIWEIAERAMTKEQVDTLRELIFAWRVANPDVESVSFVRFDDFASSRGKSVIADVRSGTGLLAPVDNAKKELNEARLFGERVFYMAKRAPLLISMQSGQLLSQVAATPEVAQAVRVAERLAESADRLTTVAEQLPKNLVSEREHIVDSIEKTSGSLRSTLHDYENAVERTDELVGSVDALSHSAREVMTSLDSAANTLTKTLEVAERIGAQFAPLPGTEPEKPVDPEVYARIVADLKGSLVEVNKALESTQTLAEGSLWQKPLEAAEKITKERVEHASLELRGLVDVVFLRAVVLIGVTFLLLFLYKAWSIRLRVRTEQKTVV